MFFLRLFLIPCLLTVAVEEITAILWGYRSWKDLFIVFLVNICTNPAVTGLRYLSGQFIPSAAVRTVIIVVLEISVVLAEWRLFRRFLSKGRYFFVFSLVMNGVSYGTGLLLPVIWKLS